MDKSLSSSTTIKIDWEFDIESDEQTQEMLGLSEGDIDAILEDPEKLEGYQRDVATLFGVPHEVDLSEFFDDPRSVSSDQITDALSDQFGWLVNDYEWIDKSCNLDQDNNIINHQEQPAPFMEDNMETDSTSTPISSSEENLMSVNDSTPTPVNEDSMITQLFQQFISQGGDPKVTEFKKHLNELINSEIKPLCGRSAKAADGSNWRSQLKARFSGKGAKWVLVPINEVNPTITQFEADGIDCDNYKTFIESRGAAWIRFAGGRLDANGNQAAAFEVRTGGSKIDHPKQLHMIPLDVLEETIRPMEGTPHSLKYEVIAEPEVEEEVETEVVEAVSEVHPDNVIVLDSEPETLEEIFDDFMDEELEDDLDDDMF